MTKQNITAWFMESGIVGIPKNIIGLMDPLGLNFDDIGKIIYILYCGCDKVSKKDRYAQEAVKTLLKKNLINWFPEEERVDFSPMFDLISENLNDKPVYVETAKPGEGELNYSQFIKNIEKKLARFLSIKEKVEIQEVVQRYSWSFDLVYDMFLFYQKNFRRQYSFTFFTQMAFSAKVEGKESFASFIENLNYTSYKVTEIKRKLGQKNYPTEIEKECYLKWANQWKFTHEMILLAVEQTIHATDPSFSYIDGILKNWYQDKITTPEELKEFLNRRKTEKTRKKATRIGQDVYDEIRDLDYLVE